MTWAGGASGGLAGAYEIKNINTGKGKPAEKQAGIESKNAQHRPSVTFAGIPVTLPETAVTFTGIRTPTWTVALVSMLILKVCRSKSADAFTLLTFSKMASVSSVFFEPWIWQLYAVGNLGGSRDWRWCAHWEVIV